MANAVKVHHAISTLIEIRIHPKHHMNKNKTKSTMKNNSQKRSAVAKNSAKTRLPVVQQISPNKVRVVFPGKKRYKSANDEKSTKVFTNNVATAWGAAPDKGTLSEYVPVSWHHPRGAKKVLHNLAYRIPSFVDALHIVFTFDPSLFTGPAEAHDRGNDKIRRIVDKLRKGEYWKGKLYHFEGVQYCRKIEFIENWTHFHLILLADENIRAKTAKELGACLSYISGSSFVKVCDLFNIRA